MPDVSVCKDCGEEYVPDQDQGGIWRHFRTCKATRRPKAQQRTAARALRDLTNQDGFRADDYGSGAIGEASNAVPPALPVGMHAQGVCERESTAAAGNGEHYAGTEDEADESDECSIVDDESEHGIAEPDVNRLHPCNFGEGNVDDNPHGGLLEEDDEGINIESFISYDSVIAWILHELTTTQRRHFFMAMRMLPVIRGVGPEFNPVNHSSIRTVEAFEAYMDKQVGDLQCGLKFVEVPIQSEVPELRSLPPVPVLRRPLEDVLSCGFAAARVQPGDYTLDPQSPANAGADVQHHRVNCFMQGSAVNAAKQVGPHFVRLFA